MHKLFRTNQSGDTIVEVLIAIAVVASVLGLSYATMNRNIIAMRDNQERSEATRLAQAQVEALNNAWGNDAARQEVQNKLTNGFCLDGLSVVDLLNAAPTADPAVDDLVTNYPNTCRYPLASPIYSIAIQRHVTNATQYYIYVRWDRIGGGGTSDDVNQTVMVYRP